jgi:pyruvate dehydrogenase E1 component alpha subunit
LPENPLLPHRKLRELHALMLRCRALEQKSKLAQPGAREALLAATTMQLSSGDLLGGHAGDATLLALAPSGKDPRLSGALTLPASGTSRLALCAAVARGLQASAAVRETGLLLAFTHAGATEPGWDEALAWAQKEQLPLVLACLDATGGKPARGRAAAPALDWPAISKLSTRTGLPVISVDGGDAVAVYRVMQECIVRTRVVGGPAVIWALTTSAAAVVPRAQQPIARLRSYMAARNIKLA